MRGFDFEHVAAYCFAEQISEYPDFLPRLKEMVGLDTIIVAGAFKPSAEVLAASPIPGQQARTVRQGIAITEDDATLRKAVEIAHRHDIAVWLLISGVRGDHTSAHHDDRGSPGGDDLKAALQALRIRPLRHAALPRGTQDGPKGL